MLLHIINAGWCVLFILFLISSSALLRQTWIFWNVFCYLVLLNRVYSSKRQHFYLINVQLLLSLFPPSLLLRFGLVLFFPLVFFKQSKLQSKFGTVTVLSCASYLVFCKSFIKDPMKWWAVCCATFCTRTYFLLKQKTPVPSLSSSPSIRNHPPLCISSTKIQSWRKCFIVHNLLHKMSHQCFFSIK